MTDLEVKNEVAQKNIELEKEILDDPKAANIMKLRGKLDELQKIFTKDSQRAAEAYGVNLKVYIKYEVSN